eukprot:scaffold11635_cov61-Phaeocystis_antarctica.AAC.2
MPAADQVPDCSATAVPRARSEAHEASPRRTPLRSRRGLLHRLVLRAPRSPYVVLESGRPINAGRGARLRACVGWSLRRFGLGLAAIVIDLLSKLLGAFSPSGSVAIRKVPLEPVVGVARRAGVSQDLRSRDARAGSRLDPRVDAHHHHQRALQCGGTLSSIPVVGERGALGGIPSGGPRATSWGPRR